MTSNHDRAAEILAPHAFVPSRAVDDLAAAGLLTEDLPEPESLGRFPGSLCWQIAPYRTVAPSTHVAVRLTHDGRIKVNLSGEIDSPRRLREAAAALLAAANHAEKAAARIPEGHNDEVS